MNRRNSFSGLWAALIIVCCCGFSAVHAQDSPEVLAIREVYRKVTADIAHCSSGSDEFCGYFLNTMNVNANNGPLAAVGIYGSKQDYWYQAIDNMDGVDMTLRKVSIQNVRSNRQESEEYLFDTANRLSFYYFKMVVDEQVVQEFRFYFKDERLVEYKEMVKETERTYPAYEKSNADLVVLNSKRFQTIFQSSFN